MLLLNRSDILAYLVVLNYEGICSREYELGRRNIMGCLVRLEKQLERLVDMNYRSNCEDRGLLELVRYREKLNVFMVQDHPQLKKATKELAELLYFYLGRKYGPMG